MQDFANSLSNIFGTARFGQQGIQRGRDLASALSAGFINRTTREEAERKRREDLLSGVAGVAGAALGQVVAPGPVGVTAGAEIGKSLFGRGDISKVSDVMLQEEALAETRERRLLTKKIAEDRQTSIEKLAGEKVTEARKIAGEKVTEASRLETINIKKDFIEKGFDILPTDLTLSTINAETKKFEIARQKGYQEVKMPDGSTEYVFDAKSALQNTLDRESAGLEAGAKKFKDETTLRREFNVHFNKFKDVRAAEGKLSKSLALNSASGDLAAIFSFMKILDPGSTVREGEFANVENSRGWPQQFRAAYNKAWAGERLTKDQRDEFLEASNELFSSEKDSFKGAENRTRDIAENMNLDTVNIFGHKTFNSKEEAKEAKLPKGTKFRIGSNFYIEK